MSRKMKVVYEPAKQEVENGFVSCITTMTSPATVDANGQVFEISVFQCNCGCPACITIIQETINKEDPTESNISQISLTPEDYPEFIKALNRAYENLIAPRN